MLALEQIFSKSEMTKMYLIEVEKCANPIPTIHDEQITLLV